MRRAALLLALLLLAGGSAGCMDLLVRPTPAAPPAPSVRECPRVEARADADEILPGEAVGVFARFVNCGRERALTGCQPLRFEVRGPGNATWELVNGTAAPPLPCVEVGGPGQVVPADGSHGARASWNGTEARDGGWVPVPPGDYEVRAVATTVNGTYAGAVTLRVVDPASLGYGVV